MANSGIAQSKTTTKSDTKTSESYNYASTFDKEKTEEVLNYLNEQIGENYKSSKGKSVWSKISDLETKNDKISIILEIGKIEINYQNKNGILNKLIVKKISSVSNFIKSKIN